MCKQCGLGLVDVAPPRRRPRAFATGSGFRPRARLLARCLIYV